MTKYGKNPSEGAAEVFPTECILTGRQIAPPFDTTVAHRAGTSGFYYRILGSQYHRVTDAHFEYWNAHAGDESIGLLNEKGEPEAKTPARVRERVSPPERPSKVGSGDGS